jgi:hypothetical protein
MILPYQQPRCFLLDGDLELLPLRPRRLRPPAIEGQALMDQMQLVLQQSDLIVKSSAPLPWKIAC